MILRSKDIHRHVTHLRIEVIDKVVDRHLDPQSQSAPLFAVNPQNLIEDPVLELQTVGVQLPENYLGDIILNDIPALLEIERTMTVLEQITRQLPFERFGTAAPGHLSRKNRFRALRSLLGTKTGALTPHELLGFAVARGSHTLAPHFGNQQVLVDVHDPCALLDIDRALDRVGNLHNGLHHVVNQRRLLDRVAGSILQQ